MLNAFRHQRTKHQRHPTKAQDQLRCSTPFGINERNTNKGVSAKPPNPAVLNAFRHQRTKHPSGAVSACQQRRAQRLSASTNETLASLVGCLCASEVLNAFRHQRTKHQDMVTLETSNPAVLNAFRHQRTKHSAWTGPMSVCRRVLNAFRHQRTKHFPS